MEAQELLFRYKTLNQREFIGVSLIEISLKNEDLQNIVFIASDLRLVNFTGADFSGAKIIRSDFTSSTLNGAKLRQAYIDSTNLSYTWMQGTDFSGANLVESSLEGAWLEKADLRKTLFCNSNLTQVCIKNAILSGADLSTAKINQEVLEDILKYSIISEDTKLPEYNNTAKKPEVKQEVKQEEKSINQGIVFNPDSNIYTVNGLRYRSQEEIKISQALDKAKTLFLPNSLSRINDATKSKGRSNKEVDFLVCHKGKWGILEVDGPFHTPARRVEEQERERLFKHHGIRVYERFDAKRCSHDSEGVVAEFLQLMEKLHEG